MFFLFVYNWIIPCHSSRSAMSIGPPRFVRLDRPYLVRLTAISGRPVLQWSKKYHRLTSFLMEIRCFKIHHFNAIFSEMANLSTLTQALATWTLGHGKRPRVIPDVIGTGHSSKHRVVEVPMHFCIPIGWPWRVGIAWSSLCHSSYYMKLSDASKCWQAASSSKGGIAPTTLCIL